MPAIFLDRDGVINKEYPNLKYQDPMKINKGAVSAIKKINKNGYLSVIVTNQPAIAKGFITLDKLKNDHKKLEYHFGKHGAYFDRIYFCPYRVLPIRSSDTACRCILRRRALRLPGIAFQQ